MFISPAFAQTAAAQGGGDIFSMIFPMILIFGIMYFLMIRPQQKKHKQHQAKLAATKRGDKVITGGGICGTVRSVKDDGRLMVEIAKGIEVEILSSTLTDVLLKTEPKTDEAKGAAPSGGLLGKLLGSKKADDKSDKSS